MFYVSCLQLQRVKLRFYISEVCIKYKFLLMIRTARLSHTFEQVMKITTNVKLYKFRNNTNLCRRFFFFFFPPTVVPSKLSTLPLSPILCSKAGWNRRRKYSYSTWFLWGRDMIPNLFGKLYATPKILN